MNVLVIYEEMLVVVIDGMLVVDICLLVCLFVLVLVEENGKCECGLLGMGGCYGLNFFLELYIINGEMVGYNCVEYLVKEVVWMVLVNLGVMFVFVGIMLIVFGVGWLGILFYEVVGYGLEGDFNCKEFLLFIGKIGELVILLFCIIVDDGII